MLVQLYNKCVNYNYDHDSFLVLNTSSYDMYCIENSTIPTPTTQPPTTNTPNSKGKFPFEQQQCVCMQCNQCVSPHYLHYLLQCSFSLSIVAALTVIIIIVVLFVVVGTVAVAAVVYSSLCNK